MKLFPHQEVARDFFLTKKRCILADAPRVGKTAPTAAAALHNLPVLVVCPAVAKYVWAKAFAQLGHTATVISGKAAAAKLAPTPGMIAVINYDILYQMQAHEGWGTMVLDEVHRIKTPHRVEKVRDKKTGKWKTKETGMRTKAAISIMKKTPHVYALSGTLIPNRPIEIWPILHGLGIYKRSWMEFACRYAKAWQSPWGLDVSGASNIPELREKLKPWVLRRKRADVFTNYQQPVVSLIELDLPVDKREKQFDADSISDLAANSPDVVLALEGISEIMREAGELKAPHAAEFIRSKIEQEPDEPLVVFAWHKSVVQILSDALNESPKIPHLTVTGATSANAKQAAIESFQAGKIQVIIGNVSSMSEGVDLSRSSTVIFAESTWATSALEQASARVENVTKQSCAPSIYILTIRTSLDSIILSKVLKKMNVIDQIL